MGALPQSVGACRAGGRLGLSPSRPSLDSLTGAGGVGVGRPVLPVNIGVLAFAAAFLVGTLVAGQSTDDIIAGFPSDLFLTLVGITYLFAVAQNKAPWTGWWSWRCGPFAGGLARCPGSCSRWPPCSPRSGPSVPGAVAIIAPIALGDQHLRRHHQRVVEEAGLPLNEIATFLASLFVNLAVAVLLFMVLGGRDLLRRRVEVTEAPGDDSSRASEAGTGESQPPSEAPPPASS